MPPADHGRDKRRLQKTVAEVAEQLYPSRRVIARFGKSSIGAFLDTVAKRGLARLMADFQDQHGDDLQYDLKLVSLACLFYAYMPKNAFLAAGKRIGRPAESFPSFALDLANGDVEGFIKKIVDRLQAAQLPYDQAELRHAAHAITRDRAFARLQESRLREIWSPERSTYRLKKETLKRAQRESQDAYSALTFIEVLQERGMFGFVVTILAVPCLAYLIWSWATSTTRIPWPGEYETIAALVPTVFAQAAPEAPPTTPAHAPFVPPFGLPQRWFNVMVTFGFSLGVIIIGVFIWKGYLAKDKSETAASFVERFATLAVGAFLGTKL